jgi:hypothetical protein
MNRAVVLADKGQVLSAGMFKGAVQEVAGRYRSGTGPYG